MTKKVKSKKINLVASKKSEDNVVTESRLKRLMKENFLKNVANGENHFFNSIVSGSFITSLEAISAKCYYCMSWGKTKALDDCPDKRCPLYSFMIDHDPDPED